MENITKGEWRVKESGACVCSPSKTICDLIKINEGPLSITEEVEANAKLIAAAPKMLKALIRVNKAIDDMKLNNRFGHTQQYIKEAIEAAS